MVNRGEQIGSLTGVGRVELGNGFLNVGTGSFSGSIEGSGGRLTKVGSGTLTLNGNNTYTGATTVSGGTLAIGGTVDSTSFQVDNSRTLRLDNSLTDRIPNTASINLDGVLSMVNRGEQIGSLTGVGRVELGNGFLNVGTGSFSGSIEGSGGRLTKVGSGTLTLNGNNTYTGATTVSAGTLALSGTLNSTVFSLTGGDLRLNSSDLITNSASINIGSTGSFSLNDNNETIGLLEGSGTVQLGSGTLTVGDSNTDSTYSGIVQGDANGKLTKRGIGTLTLQGDSTFPGLTGVSMGTLVLSGTLQSDTFAITGGHLEISESERIRNSARVSIGANGSFSIGNNNETIGALEGSGTVDLGDGTLTVGDGNTNSTYSGVIQGNPSGKFTKRGVGTLTLEGNSTYTGLTGVSMGTLVLAGVSQSDTFSVTGGNLEINSTERISDTARVNLDASGSFTLNDHDETIGSLQGAGPVSIGGATLTSAETICRHCT